MKKLNLISIGLINLLHGGLHLIQFIQSMLLITSNHNHNNESLVEKLLHNPILNVFWVIIGLYTLYLGFKDFIHHNKCKTH